ncbi:hypothetical protein [Erythrobacter mangrovi]|uniref:Uncharacterized protein n=1 Tax=Erythrobacter mangrovi TaxID=2739433 RepID=A0A7D3XBI4_9SPHN|nr:hypothetical protein [Erythrobacter mangrovi]QKG71200.1 hypothetical protein HQR01_07325 [Erythrobacter mangrovi]
MLTKHEMTLLPPVKGRWAHFALQALVLFGAAILLLMPAWAYGGGKIELIYDPANFSSPLDIHNQYFPLVPGTVLTYMGEGEDGCEWNVVTVTSDVRAVAGIDTRVVHDAAYEDEACDGYDAGELVEDTEDWFAQDDSGNVWYLGEYSQDCDGAGNCEPNDGSWEAGVNGAVAGIQMLAEPTPGTEYYQEYYEGFAEDQAKVLRTGAWISLYNSEVFDHDLHNCVVTKEWTALERGSIEEKFYCPDVGLVLVKEHHGKVLRVELVALAL